MRWATRFAVFVAIVALTAVTSQFRVPGTVVVVGALLAVYWISAIVDLLRIGPQWWLGSLAVVVLLGPLGALAYRLAAPSFSDSALAPQEVRSVQGR